MYACCACELLTSAVPMRTLASAPHFSFTFAVVFLHKMRKLFHFVDALLKLILPVNEQLP